MLECHPCLSVFIRGYHIFIAHLSGEKSNGRPTEVGPTELQLFAGGNRSYKESTLATHSGALLGFKEPLATENTDEYGKRSFLQYPSVLSVANVISCGQTES